MLHSKLLQSCLTLCDPIDCSPPGSSCPWDSPGKNTGVGCHALLQRGYTMGLHKRLMSEYTKGGVNKVMPISKSVSQVEE